MLTACFFPFPVLTTGRLVLRQLNAGDAQAIFLLRSDAQVNRFLGRQAATSVEDAHAFIQKINSSIQNREGMYWAITLKEDASLVGTICYYNLSAATATAEIGYELLPAFQGKGIMQEAISAVIAFGFTAMELKKIVGVPHAHNENSIRLLEKNKFSRDPVAQNEMSPEEIAVGLVAYSLAN